MTITTRIKWALWPEAETLCRTCRHAHIQRGFCESEEAILCGFGSPLRAVPFKVAECTDFADRCVPERWEMERMALLINVPHARKPTGFRSSAGFAAQPEDEDEEEPDRRRNETDAGSPVVKTTATSERTTQVWNPARAFALWFSQNIRQNAVVAQFPGD